MTKRLNLNGTRRGRLAFIKFSHTKNQRSYWECLCDCGNVVKVQGSGKTKSCGCLAMEAKSRNGKRNQNKQTPMDFIKKRIIINPKTKCWEWTGALLSGYARISGSKGKKSEIASRYVYEYIKGRAPGDKLVCHTCDNPKCVNPDHLFLGTVAQNFKDMKNKGRSATGERNYKAKLTEKQVEKIRKLYNKLKTTELAEKYNVSTSTINRIVKRKSWKHV